MFTVQRQVTWYDLLAAANTGTAYISGPVVLASTLVVNGAVAINNTLTLGNALTISMNTPTLTLVYPGTNTVSISLPSSAQKIATSWGYYLTMQSTGNYLYPVYEAKACVTATCSYTATGTLDQTYVLASSIPPNTQLILFLTATMYNNGGYTTSVSAIFSNATVTLTTTSTSAVTLTGSATVTTLTNGWLTLQLSALAGGTAFISNAAAVLIPVAT